MALFSLEHNGRPLSPGAAILEPGHLGGEVKAFEEWHDLMAIKQGAVSATLEVFETQLATLKTWMSSLVNVMVR